MEDIMVRYRWEYGIANALDNSALGKDLVCELTEFIDTYLFWSKKMSFACTYLYNDLDVFSTNSLLQIAFRYPGATRGGILLKRLDENRFEITGINFNVDVCFEQYAIYKKELKKDIDKYIGRILNFSKVKLINNK